MFSGIDPAWLQGSILRADDLSADNLEAQPGDGDLLIVISQSCDVVCGSFELEPLLEIHVARHIETVNGNNTYGKNPRVLDFSETVDGNLRHYRCRDSERCRIDRKVLRGTKPGGQLSDLTTRLLPGWTANRFTRAALPDEFNRRRARANDTIANIAKKAAVSLTSVYVVLNEDFELAPGEIYHVLLLGTVLPETAADPVEFGTAAKATADIAAALRACPGIEVLDLDTRSEDDVSLTERRQMLRLELDYISFREGAPTDPDD